MRNNGWRRQASMGIVLVLLGGACDGADGNPEGSAAGSDESSAAGSEEGSAVGNDEGSAAGSEEGSAAGGAGNGSAVLDVQARPSADLQGLMGATVTGDVEFDIFDGELTMTAHLMGAQPRTDYYVIVSNERSCADLDPMYSGFGMASMRFFVGDDGSGFGNSLHAADLTEASIGGSDATDIIGRAAFARPDESGSPIVACGVIHTN